MKTMPDEDVELLRGIDYLVVNGLRHEPHPSHQSIEDAIAFGRRIGVKDMWLIHLTHNILPHEREEKLLPDGVHLAYDGEIIEI